MTTSVTTSNVLGTSRKFRDLKHGQLTDSTAPIVNCPVAEHSSEIH